MKDLTTLDKYRLRDEERRLYGANGDSGNGIFKVFVNKKSFLVIVSNGGGWEHVSVSSRRNRCATWEEMCAIKDMFFTDEDCVIQYHPAKSQYVNDHAYCLHLWRPVEEYIPVPPMLYV